MPGELHFGGFVGEIEQKTRLQLQQYGTAKQEGAVAIDGGKGTYIPVFNTKDRRAAFMAFSQ